MPQAQDAGVPDKKSEKESAKQLDDDEESENEHEKEEQRGKDDDDENESVREDEDTSKDGDPTPGKMEAVKQSIMNEMRETVRVSGDGNCLFRSVKKQVNGGKLESSDAYYNTIREITARYAYTHRNALVTEFRELLTAHGGYNFGSYVVGTDKKNAREDQPVFIPKPENDKTEWDKVIKKIETPGTWNDPDFDVLVPNLIARALNRILVIYQTNLIGVDFHVTFAPTTVNGLKEARKHPKIEIFRANDHFASVIRRSE